MNTNRLFTTAMVALAIVCAAGPALAQSNSNDRRSHDRSTARTEQGTQARPARSEPARAEAVRRAEPRVEPRADVRSGSSDQRRPSQDNRANGARPLNDRRNDNRAYDNRRNDGPRYDNRSYSNRGYGWNDGYDRDSWRDRIRFGLGISIFAGRPFGFRFDYGWTPRFAYHYQMRPGLSYGGMSFLLNPDYAEVYVDGELVGIARDFGGQPVPVAAGYHRIELYAAGFEPVAFDIEVFPGQVIPYRGSLNRAY